MFSDVEPPWPVDLGALRLWPMESEDGPLLQHLFDGLADYRASFGEPGSADAVSTFVALPEGSDYDAKLLLGVWRADDLIGALDCIIGYPTATQWTVGLLVVDDRHRRRGFATAVLTWLEGVAAARGADTLRVVIRDGNTVGVSFAAARGYVEDDGPRRDAGYGVRLRRLETASA